MLARDRVKGKQVAKNVAEGFSILLGWVTPSGTETSKATSHRASIKACLENNFGIKNFFQVGSFGHGTSIRSYSDVDYFAVIPTQNLKKDSSVTLRHVKEALQLRFPNTPVYVDSPAVAVQFGTEKWERHEITPVDFLRQSNGYNVYDMPNRYGDWMSSSPSAMNAHVNAHNDRLSKKAKQLIRLVKLWNYYNDAKIRSIYIELRVAEYLAGEASVVYPIDVHRALKHLKAKGLGPMRDPTGLGANIYACADAVKPTALSKLNTAVARAGKALEADSAGKTAEAFEWWDKLYNGGFTSYY